MATSLWVAAFALSLAWLPPSLGLLECDCDPRYCNQPTCQTDGVCFVSLTRSKRDPAEVLRTRRCIDKAFLVPIERPFVCIPSLKLNHSYVSKCCRDGDFCNRRIELKLAPPREGDWTPGSQAGHPSGIGNHQGGVFPDDLTYLHVAVIVALPILLLAAVFGLFCFCHRRNYKLPERCWGGNYHEVASCETQSTYPVSSAGGVAGSSAAGGGPSLHDYLALSTGSGSGLPLLVQRSVARQISLQKVVGQGRFGEVWLGHWRGEKVAVKIFASTNEKSWFREVQIYQTVMLRHENILGFIAADNKDGGTWTQLWLVTEYMGNGSLSDYLADSTVTVAEMVRMCLGIATGVAHLHMEIVGTHGKPAIAHRDLKSKNVLVRSDGTCAVGDLGLAVRYSGENNELDVPHTARVGTVRQLAPEILSDSLNVSDFEAFKRADIYSLGLIFWELATRTSVNNSLPVPEYRLPYEDLVSPDPSIEEMRKVVCGDGARPELPSHWEASPSMAQIGKLMQECWYENPASRLAALRVKKSISKLFDTAVVIE